jgi:hypothetical protein
MRPNGFSLSSAHGGHLRRVRAAEMPGPRCSSVRAFRATRMAPSLPPWSRSTPPSCVSVPTSWRARSPNGCHLRLCRRGAPLPLDLIPRVLDLLEWDEVTRGAVPAPGIRRRQPECDRGRAAGQARHQCDVRRHGARPVQRGPHDSADLARADDPRDTGHDAARRRPCGGTGTTGGPRAASSTCSGRTTGSS